MNDDGELEERQEIVVFSIIKDSRCSECGEELWKGRFLRMEQQRPLCLECADLDHLVFLPRGDTALTRRARKYSRLSAVVVRFSRTRRRYERQGLLVEEVALERAEDECLSDADKRERARERAAVARSEADAEYVAQFAERIVALYPGCSREEAQRIAAHACRKHSGRIGRSASAKAFAVEAIDLAVKAHVRHAHTGYDDLLAEGSERGEARSAVADQVAGVMDRWRRGGGSGSDE